MKDYKIPELLHELPRVHELDLLALICGEQLGNGASRTVFEYRLDPSMVIKVQCDTERYQNQREWYVWSLCKDSSTCSLLAPCVAISPSGLWLLQKRTTPVKLEVLKRRLPRLPKFFTDCKAANWGMLGNRPVCHDYGTSLIEVSSGTRKAGWWT